MLLNPFLVAVLIALSSVASAANSPPKPLELVLEIDVLHGDNLQNASPLKTTQVVQNSDTSLEIENLLTFYASTIMVGCQREKNRVMIDIGSTDSWVMTNDLICEYVPSGMELSRNGPRHPHPTSMKASKVNDCHMSGSFNPAKSDTFYSYNRDPDFSIDYLDGTYIRGAWGTDVIRFADTKVRMTFGMARKTSCVTGRLGLGPRLDQGSYGRPDVGKDYTNFPTLLKMAGLVKKVAYSIFLSKTGSPKGKIYFGTVDHKKYIAPLQTVPIVNLYKDIKQLDKMAIKLDNIYLENGDYKAVVLDEPIGAILDSAAGIQHMPKSAVKALAALMSGKYLADIGMYQVDCASKRSSNLVYDFSGHTIKVPLEELVIERKGVCYLGAKSTSGSSYFKVARLGTSFLRNAYIVYDMENMEISMAQARYSNEEELEEIKGAIPRASRAPRYSPVNLKVDVREKGPMVRSPFGFKY